VDYKALEEQRKTKAAELKTLLDKHKNDKGEYLPTLDVKEVQARNAELNDIGEKADAARAVKMAEDNALKHNRVQVPANHNPNYQHPKGGPEEPGTAQKTLGEMVIEAWGGRSEQNPDAFKSYVPGKEVRGEIKHVDVKTLMTTSSGFAPANNRGPVVVPFGLRRPVIADLIPSDNTDVSLVRYMVETTFDNEAAPVAEGALKPQSGLGFTERQSPVQKIATWIPVTDEQLKYVPGVLSLIDNRLTLMVKLTEEVQLLQGSGVAPNLQGFLTTPGVGVVAADYSGLNNTPDAVYQAFTKVRSIGFAEPNGVVIHPVNWQSVRLLKTTQGAYIYGDPSVEGPERFWGKQAIITTAIAQGTVLTGDYAMYSHISRGMDIMVEVGFINDDFVRNQKTIRAEEYLSLEIYRASAFCKISGVV